MSRQAWILPAALSTAVVALVLTQRRRPGAAGGAAVEGVEGGATTMPDGGATMPGGTTMPGGGAAMPGGATAPGGATSAPAPPTTNELLTSYEMLLSRVQNDIRSIDPAALELVGKLLAERGYPDEARAAVTWADCARTALAESSYSPRRCGPFPYTPGQSPIVEGRDVITPRVADARRRYVSWVSGPLRTSDVPSQDLLEDELRAVGLTTEADDLRARRGQLYKLVSDNTVTAVAAGRISSDDAYARARELDDPRYPAERRYPAESKRVLDAIAARRGVVSGRTHVCTNPAGCVIYDRAGNEVYPVRLPAGHTLSIVAPANAVTGPTAPDGAMILASFDSFSGGPTNGWLLARIVEPESAFV